MANVPAKSVHLTLNLAATCRRLRISAASTIYSSLKYMDDDDDDDGTPGDHDDRFARLLSTVTSSGTYARDTRQINIDMQSLSREAQLAWCLSTLLNLQTLRLVVTIDEHGILPSYESWSEPDHAYTYPSVTFLTISNGCEDVIPSFPNISSLAIESHAWHDEMLPSTFSHWTSRSTFVNLRSLEIRCMILDDHAADLLKCIAERLPQLEYVGTLHSYMPRR